MLLGYTPKCWRESIVIFIPKPGKGDYTDARSFRPISLMSFFMKALERVVLWHLQEMVFLENPFNSNQHAFHKGRSCDSALSNMAEYLEKAQICEEYAVRVFLDIQGAFDNVTTEGMVKGMEDKNFDPAPSSLSGMSTFCKAGAILSSIRGLSSTML